MFLDYNLGEPTNPIVWGSDIKATDIKDTTFGIVVRIPQGPSAHSEEQGRQNVIALTYQESTCQKCGLPIRLTKHTSGGWFKECRKGHRFQTAPVKE